jgi:hypothetical protein
VHRQTAAVLTALDKSREDLREAIESVPHARRAEMPAAGGWSVANVLEHLAIVEPRLAGRLAQLLAEARAAGLPAISASTPSFTDADVSRYLDRARRIETGEASRPTSTLSADDAWSALESARTKTRALVIDADGLSVESITLPHAVFGPLTMYQWLGFIAGHEGRHALQIREIGLNLG